MAPAATSIRTITPQELTDLIANEQLATYSICEEFPNYYDAKVRQKGTLESVTAMLEVAHNLRIQATMDITEYACIRGGRVITPRVLEGYLVTDMPQVGYVLANADPDRNCCQ